MTHIYIYIYDICVCVFSKLTIIGSDNGLSHGRRQAIIWNNAGILLIGPIGTNFGEILNEIETFSLETMHFENAVCKLTAILSRPQCVNIKRFTGADVAVTYVPFQAIHTTHLIEQYIYNAVHISVGHKVFINKRYKACQGYRKVFPQIALGPLTWPWKNFGCNWYFIEDHWNGNVVILMKF